MDVCSAKHECTTLSQPKANAQLFPFAGSELMILYIATWCTSSNKRSGRERRYNTMKRIADWVEEETRELEHSIRETVQTNRTRIRAGWMVCLKRSQGLCRDGRTCLEQSVDFPGEILLSYEIYVNEFS